MAKVEFNFNGIITTTLCSENESMENICKRFATKIQTDITNLTFLYSGNEINLKNTLSQIMNNIDKQRKVISVLVYEKNTIAKTEAASNLVKSTVPICPECSQTTKLDILDNYNINLSECRNKHSKNLLIDEYEKTQYIDLNKIICSYCKTNQKKVYKNQMYICCTCKNILCPLCKDNHDKTHAIMNYDQKNFFCERHLESYISYCKYCKVNLCLRCQKYHHDQFIISFGSIFPEKDELLIQLSEVRKIVDVFKKDIVHIIEKIRKVKDNIEILYTIYYEMITKFDDRKRNYEAFKSINSIKNNFVFQQIQQINQTQDINSKIQSILIIHQQMTQKYNNQMSMLNQMNVQSNMMQNNNNIMNNKSMMIQNNNNSINNNINQINHF